MTNSPGTVTTDTVSSADDTVRVQVWEPGKKKIAEFPSSLSDLIHDGEYTLSRKSGVSIICARANGLPPRDSSPSCKQRIIELLGVPGFWLSYACKRSNGYFGSQSVGDGDIASWLRLIAKKIDLVHTTRPAYSWPKMNIVSRWYRATSHTVIVLFDEPADYSKAWTRSILNDAANLDLTNPFSAYAKLSAQFVELQNESVWACRTMVRNVEKQRTSDNSFPRLTHKKLDEDEKKEKEKKDAIKKSNAGFLSYKFMHEASRHTIHVSETVDAGIHVLESIEQSHARFKQAQGQSQEQAQSGWCDFLESLRFSVTMLASLKKRSDSNLQRLENEISLSYNVAAQRDSQASVQIAAAALIFLPSTFVSAVFSTSFFNYDHSAGVWSVSSQFWLYWAVAVPLTVVSILAWVVWNNYDDWMKNRRERDMSKFYAEGK